MDFLIENQAVLLLGATAIVGLGVAVSKKTRNKTDDKIFGGLSKALGMAKVAAKALPKKRTPKGPKK
jgi:hypothetical protein